MKRLIKADELDACVGAGPLDLPDVAGEARRLLAEAGREARRLVEDAQRAAEGLRAEAERRGHEEGLARGRAEGLAEGRRLAKEQAVDRAADELAQTAELARKVVTELAAQREQILANARAEMLDFALELARRIVGRAADGDAEAARENLRKALELADAGGDVTVFVHPSQVDLLRRHAPKIVDAVRFHGKVKLVGDDSVGRGGVRLVSRQGEIDATIAAQLQNVADALRGPSCRPNGL